MLDVSALTTLTQTKGGLEIDATNGGEVNLSGLSSLGGSFGNVINDTGNSVLLDSHLTSLDGDKVTLDGTDSQVANSWTSFTNGTLTVTGATVTLPGLADVDGSNLYAKSGGTLALPGLTSYSSNGSTFQADGALSMLDISALTTLTQQNPWSIVATNGGVIKLTGVTQVNGPDGITLTDTGGSKVLDGNLTSLRGVSTILDGSDSQVTSSWTSFTNGTLTVTGTTITLPGLADVDGSSLYAKSGGTLALPGLTSYSSNGSTFQADGALSVLDLSALTTLTQQSSWSIVATKGGEIKLTGVTQLNGPDGITLTDTEGSKVLDGNLTNLSGVNATLDGTDSQVASSWTSFTNGTLTVTGTAITLPGLTDVDGSSLYAKSGGGLALPGLTSYSSNGTTFQADGTLSVLDVSALTTLTQQNPWSIAATNGGEIKLTGMTSLEGVKGINLTDTGGSKLMDGNVTRLDGVAVTVDGTDAAASNSWTSLTNGSLELSTGSLTFGNLSDAIGSTLTVGSGASLNLPAITLGDIKLDNGARVILSTGSLTMPAANASAVTLNVPSLPLGVTLTLANSGTWSGGTTFNVIAGSHVALAGGTYTGGAIFNVGVAATVDLTGGQVSTFAGTLTGTGAGIVQFSGGEIDAGTGGMTLNFAGSMFHCTGGVFRGTNGSFTNQGTFNLSGGFILANGSTLFNFGTLIESGLGSIALNSNGSNPSVLNNELGGQYLIESDGGVNGNFGTLDNAGTIRVTAGDSSILQPTGPLNNTGTIEVDSGTLALLPSSITQLSGSALTGGTWAALDGATLKFPSGTAITSNAATISLAGLGATIDGISQLNANSGSVTVANGAQLTVAGAFSNSGSLTLADGGLFSVTGNFTQTAAGTLIEQMGGTPQSGLFGRATVGGTATLAGTLALSLVNSYSPPGGQKYQFITYASASGHFASVTGLPSGMTVNTNSGDLELDTPFTQPDLVATSISASASSAASGQTMTFTWQATNQSPITASGSWLDSVYLSTTPTITSSSVLIGSAQHNGGLSSGSTYSGSLSAALPAVPPGLYYVLVDVDSIYQVADQDRLNNVLAAPAQLQISFPTLALGAPRSDSFSDADQDNYYQVSVPAGGSLNVSLQSSATGSLALYVSQGSPPTPSSYQQGADLANQANQTVMVPSVPTAGTYYVLAHSISGDAATASYTLTVTRSSGLTVSAISSYAGGNAGNVTIEIDGTNFTPNVTASLTLGATPINDSTIDFVSASQIFATFDLTGAAVGNYTLNVHARRPVGVGTEHVPGGGGASPAPLNVALIVPQYMRSGRTGTIVISYSNTTSNDMVAPLLEASSTNANVSFSTPDDPNDYVKSAQVLAVSPSGPAGILRPGQSGQLTLTLLTERHRQWRHDPRLT